nr:reverse transcriptase domain-containing protein [Tanacetum cinerariifolium]
MPNPQEFFLPEEFSSSKKQGHDQSSSSTSTLPQAFEIGESSQGAIGLICWFKRTESVFSHSNCTEDCKIEEDYKIIWVEFKKLLIKKYCPQTEIQKIEEEFYHMTVKGNDLKTCVRRFQELATLCPTMVLDSEMMIEAFIEGLPRSIKGNVTASKHQTLEESINIAQWLMDRVTKHTPIQVSSDHK